MTPFAEAHNATADVEATTRCFFRINPFREQYTKEQLDVEPDFFQEFLRRLTRKLFNL